jgi:phosphoglycerate dehydrogenase-like enzyme
MLNGATLGIIGVGEIGREIAIRAAAFGMRILYYQRTRLPAAEERELEAAYVPFETLLAQSDWVVPQVPGGPATRGFIGRAQFAQMKPGAFLVNVARADIVDRAALIEALTSGRLGGFALDPLYEAPGRSDDELLGFDNVVLSPHIAAQPRFNALDDLADMMEGLSKELAP